LHDDKDAADTMLFAGGAVGAATLADAGAEVNAGVFEDGNATKEQADENGQEKGEEESRAVNADFVEAWNAGGSDSNEDAESGIGEAEAESTAENAEDEAFEEKVRGDAIGPSAKGGADGEFLAAAFHTNEEEIGDVGTSDEENEADGGHK
jgi:hypothetical protein